jgi:cytidylate kinase
VSQKSSNLWYLCHCFKFRLSSLNAHNPLTTNKIIIAIDGHSSCGKSTFAKQIAIRLGYLYIDSGAMYRAVTLTCLRNGIIRDGIVGQESLSGLLANTSIAFKNDPKTNGWQILLNGVDVEAEIRSLEVSRAVSLVAAIPLVRSKMVEQQQEMGKNKGIVMDGRDIGTVVFPHAELKIFMTADPMIRAQRRLTEIIGSGQSATLEEVLANIEERDRIDQTREASPLRKASDAIVLDNSSMTVEEQMKWVMELVSNITQV